MKASGVLGENAVSSCYLDSLLELEIQEEKGGKRTDDEIIYLYSEFIKHYRLVSIYFPRESTTEGKLMKLSTE